VSENGALVISLDFELFWGVRDKLTLENYGPEILGVWEAMPKMLKLFQEFNIRATFATVGFLFANNKAELETILPNNYPEYEDQNLSPFKSHFETLDGTPFSQKTHFAPELIELLNAAPEQEIGTHTLSHYYCLEPGQTVQSFEADLEGAVRAARLNDITLKSIVFPRNQFNSEYVRVLLKHGIKVYRGNETSWFYRPTQGKGQTMLMRAFRLLDAYVNISGHNSYKEEQTDLINIPSSRFLRPYSARLKHLERLRLARIKKSMTYAARNKEVYHLWWHPHNFGTHQIENMSFLRQILLHFKKLNKTYSWVSMNMGDFIIE